jgi:hypothetical protein
MKTLFNGISQRFSLGLAQELLIPRGFGNIFEIERLRFVHGFESVFSGDLVFRISQIHR